jgi:hypothetical protein
VNRSGPDSMFVPFTSPGSVYSPGALTTLAWVDKKRDLIGIFLIQRFPDTFEERNKFISIVSSAVQE